MVDRITRALKLIEELPYVIDYPYSDIVRKAVNLLIDEKRAKVGVECSN